MANESSSNDTLESASASAEPVPQAQVTVDDADAKVLYSKQVLVSGTDEDITLDFGANIRPTGNNTGKLKIDQRVILSPFAAKRLAITLGQVVTRYEQTYGTLELDPRKRMVQRPTR